MRVRFAFFLLIQFFTTILCGQSVPNLINYQGRLTDATGAGVAAGLYVLQFRIWDDPLSADPIHLIWGQTQTAAAQANGVFNVLLGAPGGTMLPGTAVNDLRFAFTDSVRLLGVTIVSHAGTNLANPIEIQPRQRLMSVPFAMTAQGVVPGSIVSSSLAPKSVDANAIADGAVQSSSIASGAVGSAQIANGAIGAAQLASGAVAFVPRSIQVFTSSTTWNIPDGISRIYVKMWGGGGGGGGTLLIPSRAGGTLYLGGGGGSGGFCEGVIENPHAIAITLGSGGAAGHYGQYSTDGENGGNTVLSVDGSNIFIAGGGGGGARGAGPGNNPAAGGFGGAASGSAVVFAGQSGYNAPIGLGGVSIAGSYGKGGDAAAGGGGGLVIFYY